MAEPSKAKVATPTPHEQMLRLVAKGFYKELINYGVKEPEIVTVASHLLDNVVLKSPPASKTSDPYNRLFKIKDVQDQWAAAHVLQLGEVSLRPLDAERMPLVASWLSNPKVGHSFFPRFPETVAALADYFRAPSVEYFGIYHLQDFVGIIGAEQIDAQSSKLEMKKLVGDPNMRGKGIGKRATFLFLYHVFVIRNFYKVYLHTLDINIRNLNLNGNLGFWLEGVFFDDVRIEEARQDLLRMALTQPSWRNMFG